MVDPRVVTYIQEQLQAGFSDEQIRLALMRQGWTPEAVHDAFEAAKKPSSAPTNTSSENASPANSDTVQTDQSSTASQDASPATPQNEMTENPLGQSQGTTSQQGAGDSLQNMANAMMGADTASADTNTQDSSVVLGDTAESTSDASTPDTPSNLEEGMQAMQSMAGGADMSSPKVSSDAPSESSLGGMNMGTSDAAGSPQVNQQNDGSISQFQKMNTPQEDSSSTVSSLGSMASESAQTLGGSDDSAMPADKVVENLASTMPQSFDQGSDIQNTAPDTSATPAVGEDDLQSKMNAYVSAQDTPQETAQEPSVEIDDTPMGVQSSAGLDQGQETAPMSSPEATTGTPDMSLNMNPAIEKSPQTQTSPVSDSPQAGAQIAQASDTSQNNQTTASPMYSDTQPPVGMAGGSGNMGNQAGGPVIYEDAPKSSKLWIIIPLLGILIAGAVVAYFVLFADTDSSLDLSWLDSAQEAPATLSEELGDTQDGFPLEQDVSFPEGDETTPAPLACNDDVRCFVERALACEPITFMQMHEHEDGSIVGSYELTPQAMGCSMIATLTQEHDGVPTEESYQCEVSDTLDIIRLALQDEPLTALSSCELIPEQDLSAEEGAELSATPLETL